jgi:hypothetical protein
MNVLNVSNLNYDYGQSKLVANNFHNLFDQNSRNKFININKISNSQQKI